MPGKSKIPIDVFIASGAETVDLRDMVERRMSELSAANEDSEFYFRLRRWENDSAAVSKTKRLQDIYNKEIENCDMVAVIIRDTAGKYTQEEFNHAVKMFLETGKPAKVVVYTLPARGNDRRRFNFINSLRKNGFDHFADNVETPERLLLRLSDELTRIKCKIEADYRGAVEGVKDTVSRLDLDSDLTKEAVRLFEENDYTAASEALDIEKIRELSETLSAKQKEVAEAFVLKAKLVLTEVTNKERFAAAEGYFEEALIASREPKILFEVAMYLQTQNNFTNAERLYIESLQLSRHRADEPNIAVTLNNLGNLYCNTSQFIQAEEAYTEALAIHRRLAENNPAAYAPDVAMTLSNLGLLHRDINRRKQAAEEFTEALALITPYYEVYPQAFQELYGKIQRNLDELTGVEAG